MKILVTGYYGAGNFGDDIMLETFINNIKGVSSNQVDVLKLFELPLELELNEKAKIYDFSRVPGKLRNLYIKFILRKYDMFLWVGGTCFTDTDGDGLHRYMTLAKKMGVKIGYIGVGVGDLTIHDRIEKTKFLTENSQVMSFRDEKSYKYCKNISDKNKHLTEDLAYLYFKEIFRKQDIKQDNSLVVSWRNLIGYCEEKVEFELIDELVKGVLAILEKKEHSKVIVLPLDDRKDKEKNKYIYEALKDNKEGITVEYIESATPKEKVDFIRRCTLNVSGRLHGIFISELLNIKTIPISYSNKIDYFLMSIDKGDEVINVQDLSKEQIIRLYEKDFKFVSDEKILENIKKSEKNIAILT